MSLSKKYLYLIFFILWSAPSEAFDNCNFKTSKYIEQLNNPSSITEIEIKIPKSRNYIKNFAEILTSKSENIPSSLRKKFKAKLNIIYPFGNCIFNAKIWQNGDWKKDHLALKNGNPMRSLNVRLLEGNVFNAIKFKLLLPESRNFLNEVLGTLIIRKIGFIAPETFEVKTNINGIESVMLFQEDSQKELLERNLRKEGPIFEGDESLLWSNKYKNMLELENISLARLINSNYLSKGENALFITTNSFHKIQNIYLEYSQTFIETGNPFFLRFDKNNSKLFQDFYFLMDAMNGWHGLRPHNRKFYYNLQLGLFEPIYYDGNLKINLRRNADNFEIYKSNTINGRFQKDYIFPYTKLINNTKFRETLQNDFESRVIYLDNEKLKFFHKSFNTFLANVNFIQQEIPELKNSSPKIQSKPFLRKQYLKKLAFYKQNQKTVNSFQLFKKFKSDFLHPNNNVKIYLEDESILNINLLEFKKILRKNKFKDMRFVFLPESNKFPNFVKEKKFFLNIESLGGFISYSNGISFKIDEKNKLMNITQSKATEWININNADLKDWVINFKGIEPNQNNKSNKERINKEGLTGCLNIYNSKFNKTILRAINGECEDSINVSNSRGMISNLEVENAFQDGVDLDFSNLNISNIKIKNANNDCLDLSGGSYYITRGELTKCGDKGISVGEKSYLNTKNIIINSSNIALSVKDLSKVSVDKSYFMQNKICIEAFQKKQEFGGGLALFENLKCNSKKIIDKQSTLKIKNEF